MLIFSFCKQSGYSCTRRSTGAHILQDSGGPSNKIHDSRFRSVVLGVRFMGNDTSNTSSCHNLASRHLILAHEMNRQLSTVHYPFVVDICT